jgi:putative Ca2+/H+ antiporter (TMEM165/GDT1 family)
LGVVTLIIGLILRSERGEKMFAIGVTLAALAGFLVVLGYLVPLLALPALSESTWMGVFPRLANHNRNLTLALAVAALAIGAIVTLGSGSRKARRQQSTPLSVGRYREDRSWSR